MCVEEASGRWIAARDHAGVCPLYVGWHADGTFWFASEMKALVDDCYRVDIVPPGHAWSSDERGSDWSSGMPRAGSITPHAAADLPLLRDVLVEAVRKRMMSDVPWGVLLSGGVDSSIVASIATRLCRESGAPPPRSFAIGLEGGPDLAAARRVADFLGTIHHELTFTIDEAMDAIPAAVSHLESYQQVRTAVPTMILARKVRDAGVKMVLSGEGADELLGGYLYFHSAPSASEFHAETVRKTMRLHLYDVMRANKAPMAHGVELRFPFLDRAFIDVAMSMDPADRMIGPMSWTPRHRKRDPALGIRRSHAVAAARSAVAAERAVLRRRRLSMGRHGARRRVNGDRRGGLADARAEFAEDPPVNAEMSGCGAVRGRVRDRQGGGRTALATVGTGRSIACSTPEAVSWNPAWARLAGDISGRAIAGIHMAFSDGQVTKSGGRHAMLDAQQSYGRLQVEAPRTGGAGVHDQRLAAWSDHRLVRVAVDDDVSGIEAHQVVRRRAPGLVTVAHMDLEAFEREIHALLETQRRVVSVAEHSMHRRDALQLTQDGKAANIAGVKYQLDSVKSGKRLGTNHRVRVRDESDKHGPATYRPTNTCRTSRRCAGAVDPVPRYPRT